MNSHKLTFEYPDLKNFKPKLSKCEKNGASSITAHKSKVYTTLFHVSVVLNTTKLTEKKKFILNIQEGIWRIFLSL